MRNHDPLLCNSTYTSTADDRVEVCKYCANTTPPPPTPPASLAFQCQHSKEHCLILEATLDLRSFVPFR